MVPSAKLSVLAEITKAPVRVALPAFRTSMLFSTSARGITPTFKYVGLSSGTATAIATIDEIVLAAGTIEALVFHLTAPPGLGNSVTLELLVNGSPTGLIATISGAVDQTGIAVGSVAVAADDTLACQAGFVGAVAATIRSVGAIVNSRETWNPASGAGLVGSGSIDSAAIQAVNVTRVGFKDTTPTGSPTTIDIDVGGSTVDSVAVAAGLDKLGADVSVNVSAGTTEVLLLANTGDLAGPGRKTSTYQNLDEPATLCLLAHDALYQWSLTNDPTFADWDGAVPVLSEPGTQGAWPLAGTIKTAVLYVPQFTSTNGDLDDVNVSYILNINGVGEPSLSHTFQKLSSDRFQLLTGLNIHLNQGDLVSRLATPDNFNALNFKIRMLVAFVPD